LTHQFIPAFLRQQGDLPAPTAVGVAVDPSSSLERSLLAHVHPTTMDPLYKDCDQAASPQLICFVHFLVPSGLWKKVNELVAPGRYTC
jgi:hypothetical protein